MTAQLAEAQQTAEKLLQQKRDILEDVEQLKNALDTSQQLIDDMETDLEVVCWCFTWFLNSAVQQAIGYQMHWILGEPEWAEQIARSCHRVEGVYGLKNVRVDEPARNRSQEISTER